MDVGKSFPNPSPRFMFSKSDVPQYYASLQLEVIRDRLFMLDIKNFTVYFE
jgi:hypothetical protein